MLSSIKLARLSLAKEPGSSSPLAERWVGGVRSIESVSASHDAVANKGLSTDFESIGATCLMRRVAPILCRSLTFDLAERWGNGTLIKSPKQFSRASRDVIDMLEQQRVIRLEGLFLPGDVTLKPEQSGIRIAAQ